MRTRHAFLLTLAASAILLGASLAAALAPLPQPPGASPSRQGGGAAPMGGGGGNGTGNETELPANETKPPSNETKPPSNETKPPKNDTAKPLPPPEVTPENQSLAGRAGVAVPFEVVVTNPAKEPQNVSVTLTAPFGWSASVQPHDPVLDAGESVTLHGSVHSALPSRGVVRIDVMGQDGGDVAWLDVCFQGLLQVCPAPGGNQTEPNGTKPPGNETQPPKNDTKPPKNETQPPGNETQPPQNGTAEAPAPAQATVGGPLLGVPREDADVAVRLEDVALGVPVEGPAGDAPVRAAGEAAVKSL